MRKLKIKLSSGLIEELEIPYTLYDLSTGVFENIINNWTEEDTIESVVELFSILAAKDLMYYLKESNPKIKEAIVACTKFIYEGAFKELQQLEVPKTLLGVEIPTKLGGLTLAQNLHVRKKVGSVKDIRGIISFVCAVYLQPLLDESEFNDKRVEYYEGQFKLMPITQTYPVGLFYLNQLKNSGHWLINLLAQIKRIIVKDMKNVSYLVNKLRANYLNLMKA